MYKNIVVVLGGFRKGKTTLIKDIIKINRTRCSTEPYEYFINWEPDNLGIDNCNYHSEFNKDVIKNIGDNGLVVDCVYHTPLYKNKELRKLFFRKRNSIILSQIFFTDLLQDMRPHVVFYFVLSGYGHIENRRHYRKIFYKFFDTFEEFKEVLDTLQPYDFFLVNMIENSYSICKKTHNG